MKILVVDDHVLIREALRGVLGELCVDATVLEAADATGGMAALTENPDIDLVLLDLYLPDRSGFELLAGLRDSHPAVPVVVLTVSVEREDIGRAMEMGAVGFIPKSARREVMLGGLRLVLDGGIYVPPEIFARPPPAPVRPAAPAGPLAAAALGLTERQSQVLALMMRGRSNKAICRALGLAEPTVKNHVTAILKALKVTNRTEAVITAAAAGLGPDADPA